MPGNLHLFSLPLLRQPTAGTSGIPAPEQVIEPIERTAVIYDVESWTGHVATSKIIIRDASGAALGGTKGKAPKEDT